MLVAENITGAPDRIRTVLPFVPEHLAVRSAQGRDRVAAAGGDKVAVVDRSDGRVRKTYGNLGVISGVSWAGRDAETLLVLADGELLMATEDGGGSFPEHLTPVPWWRGWAADRDPVRAFAASPHFELIAALLQEPYVHTWSLEDEKSVNLMHVDVSRRIDVRAPVALGWRSIDAFYVHQGRRVTSYHPHARMTETVSLPVDATALVWLADDVLAFVAGAGPHAGRLGCVAQARPSKPVWVDVAGGRVTTLHAIQSRRTLVVGTEDGRVSLFDSGALKAATGRPAGPTRPRPARPT
jgi:hypothetical protein